jgi:hypothetical protein
MIVSSFHQRIVSLKLSGSRIILLRYQISIFFIIAIARAIGAVILSFDRHSNMTEPPDEECVRSRMPVKPLLNSDGAEATVEIEGVGDSRIP